ncbi:hypothetical protein ACKWTF_014873 [Chironomus riparius]
MTIKEVFVFVACFAMLCGFGDSVDIQCEYGTSFYHAVGYVYECVLQNTLNIKSRESAVINSVNGSHSSGKTSADVTGFWSWDSTRVIEYFPRNLDNIFTNLKMIVIQYGRLKEIQQSDLRPFTKLVLLSLYNNDIEFLEDGLFAYNPELEFVSFFYNKIIHIGSQVFDNLNKLTWLYLHKNTCIDMDAENNQTAVKEVISQAKVKCYNSEYLIIDNELAMIEDKLFCANSEALPVLTQHLKDLQTQYEKSNFSKSWSLKERFEALNTFKIQNRGSVGKKMMTKLEKIQDGISMTSTMQKIIPATSTTDNSMKLVISISCSIMFLINIVLIVIYHKIKTE